MTSVNITQEEKTEILDNIVRSISKTAIYKLPKQPDLTGMVGRALDNWFNKNMAPHMENIHLKVLIPQTEALEVDLGNLPEGVRKNIELNAGSIKFVGTRNRAATWGGMPYELKGLYLSRDSRVALKPQHVKHRINYNTIAMPFNTEKVGSTNNSWSDNRYSLEMEGKTIPLEYYNYDDVDDFARYVDAVNTVEKSLSKTVYTIVKAVNEVKTSKQFREKFPELINMIPASVITRERKKDEEKAKPVMSTVIQGNSVQVDLSQITKDIAFATIIGDEANAA